MADKKEKIIPPPPVFKDQSGLTDQKLEAGLWYIRNFYRLKKALIGFLIAVAVFSWGYFFYGFLKYIFVGMAEDQALVDGAAGVQVAGHDYILSRQPAEIKFGAVQVLNNSTAETYDFLVEADNPNPRHWAEFQYAFSSGGRVFSVHDGFILPGENKFLAGISEEASSLPFGAEIVITNLRWHRIAAKDIPDWNAYYAERMNFAISNAAFSPGGEISEKLNLCRVDFTAANNTPYNYWSVNFLVLVYQSGRAASLSSYTKENFMSGQSVDLSLAWPSSITRAAEVKIIPELNIMRDNIYIPFEGEVKPDAGRQ